MINYILDIKSTYLSLSFLSLKFVNATSEGPKILEGTIVPAFAFD